MAILLLVISYVIANVMGWLPLQLVAWMRHLCVPYLVFFFAFQKNWLNQLGRYGDFSYGVYVFGYPIQQLIVLWLGPETSVAVLTLLCFVGVLPLAYLSWHGVEKPFMKFKNSLK
jgi:peptidoglycan/LPS O-acetylase OafA/YrhL